MLTCHLFGQSAPQLKSLPCWVALPRVGAPVLLGTHSRLRSLTWGEPEHMDNVQLSSTQSCPFLCDPMDCSIPYFPVHHQLPESTQNHVHWVSDAIQPSHPLSFSSLPAFNLFQHQRLFKRVSSSHQMAKALEFQLQHQSFQWIPRTDLL